MGVGLALESLGRANPVRCLAAQVQRWSGAADSVKHGWSTSSQTQQLFPGIGGAVVKRWMQNLLFVVLIVFGTSAYAMQGVFWQPQLRDLHISDHAWAGLMAQVREQGFDTLVLQWTRHDDSFSEVQQWQQLLKKTIAARQAGLKIIVGLHWDSQFFTLQKQPADALAAYLRQLAARDLQQLVLWQSRLPFVPDGWYVSAEIDDKNWRSQAQRKRLLGWLSSLRRGLGEHSGEPV